MSQSGQVIIGDNLKLYYDTAGAEDGEFENEVPTIENISVPDSRQVGELNQRGKSFVLKATGRRDLTISFTMPYRPGDTDFEAIRTAYTTSAVIGLLVLSGPKSEAGHIGIQADCEISKFELDAPNDANPSSVSCEAVLSMRSDFDPTDYVTTGDDPEPGP